MKTQSVLITALAAAPSALAHTVWSTFYVDGVGQGDGVAMRMRQDPEFASWPLRDYAADTTACNLNGTTGVSRVQPVPDGSTLTFEMRSWPDDPSKPSLDPGHHGPCAVYLKKVDSAVTDTAAGEGWFKLFDNGYDASNDEWCTDRLISNNGRLSVKLPEGLQGGHYLARPEVLALHNATNGDAQLFTGCAQIFLESTGDLVPESTVAIPGTEYMKAGDPESVQFNIYTNNNAAYKISGPAVAKLTSSGAAASGDQASQKEGVRPSTCIDENANWCGTEVPSYTDETGCWAASKDCWAQNEACYDQAPPTGHKGCTLWQAKCDALDASCKAKTFTGPPDQGKDLTPKAETIEAGLVMSTSGGGVVDTPKTSASAEASSSVVEAKPSSSSVEAKPTSATVVASSVATPVAAASSSKATSVAVAAALSSSSAKEVIMASAAPVVSSQAPQESVTSQASVEAPAPTSGACPKGYVCVTQVATEVVTEVQYVTVDAYNKRSGLHARRAGRNL